MKGDKCIHDPCLLAILDQGHPLEGSQESTGLVLNTMMKITVVFARPRPPWPTQRTWYTLQAAMVSVSESQSNPPTMRFYWKEKRE